MLILVLKLFLAHILGDFVFQTRRMTRMKQIKRKGLKGKALLCHTLIHLLLLLILLQFDWSYWLGISVIISSHLLIDLGKIAAKGIWNERWLFFIDQLLHITVISGVVYYYSPFQISVESLYHPKTLLLIVSLLLITFVTAITIKILISSWKPIDKKSEDLKNAGTYIGMLERLFIFGFICINYWEGIGFLLAAKSVFRFGDLSRAEDRNLTEYILIGTLLSFGLAILIAIGYNNLLEIINAL